MPPLPVVLVLAGGPDAEREVSLMSGRAIAAALDRNGRYRAELRTIDRLTPAALRAMPGDVIFPALHGKYGEGGPLQEVMEEDGRPFVGSGVRASRTCIDKVLTKSVAARAGLRVTDSAVLDPGLTAPPFDFPLVAKPVFEGSTIGLFICRTPQEWATAHAAACASGKPYMAEPFISGREYTLGLIPGSSRGGVGELRPVPLIHIAPADGLYDYQSKYFREDTRYHVAPPVDPAAAEEMVRGTCELARLAGVRHLCRADFILDDENRPHFLELNTLPGFTDHSLVPMAARHIGIEMPELCGLLVEAALSERR